MRWCALVLVCAVIVKVNSEPEPKKYKQNDAEKDKKSEPSLTQDEKTFLRQVEEKFGVKAEVPSESVNNSSDINILSTNSTKKTPLPAVIAIEIVNDTESNTKGKRTIDANLGYGYRTNNGYTYTYFGKPTQEKGKFMIYPYSQQHVSLHYNSHEAGYSHQPSDKQSQGTSVEIQPSQAFELVSVKDNRNYDESTKPVDSSHTYEKNTPTTHPSTLYTTYNGEGLSGLSGQFPSLMSNYFVQPNQLLTNPQYQDIGLTQDHLSTNGLDQHRPVVPVLVLRIPSSYLKNPTAELYANLPNNYPLSNYLNNVNLQDLVNDYFKKNGYNSAPQVMTYQNSHALNSDITTSDTSSERHQPQQYSNPEVQPSYTQADYSGVQYSAVKPVMAKYPSSFRQKYLSPQIQSQYRKPIQQQKYEYRYQNVPRSAAYTQANYEQSLYQNQHQSLVSSYEQQKEYAAVAKESTDAASNAEYKSPQYSTSHGTQFITVDYEGNTPSQISSQVSENSNTETPQYDISKESQAGYSSQESLPQGYSSQLQSDYSSSQLANEYYLQTQPANKESINTYPSQGTNSEQGLQTYSNQGYDYSKPEEESGSYTLVTSENYPSKDHTIATVLPFSYKEAKKPNKVTVQTVSYVTPEPLSANYLSHFRVMVPQTVLKSHDSEKVMYVNSRPMHYTKTGYYNQDYNPEEDYTVGTHYMPQTRQQKPSSYPRNYHSYPKRMTRPGSKAEASAISSSLNKKQNGKNIKHTTSQ